MSQKIVGVKITKSADGTKTYHNYFYTERFSDYDYEHAQIIEGVQAGVEYSGTDIGCQVGDEVEFKYAKGFQGKAQLVGCTVIKPAAQPIGKK